MSAPPVVTVSQENVNNKPSLLTTGGRTLYTVSCTARRYAPSSTAYRYYLSIPHPGDAVATVSFYPISTCIYVALRGQRIVLHKGFFSSSHAFRHPAAAGTLKWSPPGNYPIGREILPAFVLSDGKGRVLCQYTKQRGFEVLVPVDNDALLDVILVTGLGVVEYSRWHEFQYLTGPAVMGGGAGEGDLAG
ncbi:hypothetical protein IMZ48_09290 [Candidatus Bathyarchaeota archaeon]|nr:hypothetical protein [Candidatus Bathyarchaeota archaeon]